MDFLKSATTFAPTGLVARSKKTLLAPVTFVDKIIVPILPKNASDLTRLHTAIYMMMAGTSEEGTPSEWKSYVAAYVCLVTPTFPDGLSPGTFTKVEMSAAQVTDLNTHMTSLVTALEADDEGLADAASEALKSGPLIPGLPSINPNVDLLLSNGEWINKVVICHYSIVLFLAGKRLDGADHTQATVSRPLALRGKAHITDSLEFLEGELRLSDSSHLMINNAWSEMSQLRALVFNEYAYYSSSETDAGQDLIFTTMHLLRFSNMAHAKITFDFLRAYPWAVEVPALKTPIGIYADSVRASQKIDPAIFPYVKLIYGDKSNIFPRKELEPLVACAATVNQSTQASLADFYRSNAFNPIVEAFLEEKARRENIRDLTLKKQEVDLLDYEESSDEQTEDGSGPAGALIK
jgi:hypothetical protein